ncbi:AMP-dependent synthetase, partial [Mycobacterium sp. ITM-2017-0098]
GLRIDLHQLETTLRADGITALCTADDERLAVVAAGQHDPVDVRRAAANAAGVPAAAVDAAVVEDFPTLPSGKPDYPAARALAAC